MLDPLANIHPWLPAGAGLAILLLGAFIGDVVVRRGLVAVVHIITDRTALPWTDALVKQRVFTRLSHVIPALVIVSGINLIPMLPDGFVAIVENVGMAYVVLMIAMALAASLTAANNVYDTYEISRNRPLKGVIQVVQLAVYIVGIVLMISTLIERSPLILLSGFGAMTAVLLLVFKDTILGFVASVQLTANDMVRVGDWIEMPAYGADGDVLEVALHTVKVQNFDKTITTIPTYKLFSESFKNWRGMSESGGRRIKRSIQIDQSSIRFLDDSETEHLSSFGLLREHFSAKQQELRAWHESLPEDSGALVNRRRLTNIGVFRAYVQAYLRQSPHIHEDMTLLVRQLSPGPEGLPIEIYCFTRTTDWIEYEDRQSDIFDHFIAIVHEFGLRVFQNPAGSDLERIGQRGAPQ